jgi:large subunit ribosomal protein L29
MAKQQKDSLKGKSAEELKGQVAELKKELFNLRFQKAQGELTNTSRFRAAKKEIARILTALRSSQNAA